jgi:hypothetical protein
MESVNVIEYYVYTSPTTCELRTDVGVDIRVEKDRFQRILQFISKSDGYAKPFAKKSKVNVVGTMFYEVQDNNEIKTYSRNISTIECRDGFVHCMIQYHKLPFHQFPCTRNLNDSYYTSKLIFKLHNRLFLNFVHVYHHLDETSHYKIYINYNHDTNVESQLINSLLHQCKIDIATALNSES